jgi:two-component system sensor kinase FixL
MGLTPLDEGASETAVPGGSMDGRLARLPSATRALLETAPEALLLTNRRGCIVFVNARSEHLFGYSADELVGERVEKVIARLVGVRRDGSEFPAEISLSPLETEDGLLAMTAIREIGESTPGGRPPAVSSGMMQMRDEFLSIAAHELRTPLTALQLQLDALEQSLNTVDPQLRDGYARVHAKIEKAARNASRLADLVNTLLDLTRIMGGRLDLRLEETNLAAVVRERVAEFRELERTSAVLVDAPELLPAICDRGRFEQIVNNLLSNASKYGEGGPIEVRLAGSAGAVELTVRDHGIGVAPADRERIFEKFERAPAARKYSGMGLGLYITRRLAEAHGGTIDVVPTAGPGATFVLRLPQHLADQR